MSELYSSGHFNPFQFLAPVFLSAPCSFFCYASGAKMINLRGFIFFFSHSSSYLASSSCRRLSKKVVADISSPFWAKL